MFLPALIVVVQEIDEKDIINKFINTKICNKLKIQKSRQIENSKGKKLSFHIMFYSY